MGDEELRRLAEKLAMRIHLGEVNAGGYRGANTYRQVLTDEILKVATEAARQERERINREEWPLAKEAIRQQERERIEGIVHEAILLRIKGGER